MARELIDILCSARKSRLGWDIMTDQSKEAFANELVEDLISTAVDYGAESYRLRKTDAPSEELAKKVEALEARLANESERFYAFLKGLLK